VTGSESIFIEYRVAIHVQNPIFQGQLIENYTYNLIVWVLRGFLKKVKKR